jgi:glycosyltransferase involved in cell wall biosynthesis
MADRTKTVGLNALFFDPGVSGGSETYLRELVPALAAARPHAQLSVVSGPRGLTALRELGWEDIVRLERLPANDRERVRKTAAEQVLLPHLARIRGWDVLHSLSNLAPIRPPRPSVLTLLDVIFFTHPTFGWLSNLGMRQVVSRAAPRADAVITITSAARSEIRRVLSLEPGRITVIPLGAGRASPSSAASDLDARHDLPSGRMALCVAAVRPQKNQAVLVRALPHLPADVNVVCVGRLEGSEGELRRLANELRVAERLRLLGSVSDPDIEALWKRASCAVFPTRAEGFGLPVLEAMRRGVPVACSDIPPLREVAGDAARRFDPEDERAAAAAIVAALDDPDLPRAGRERAATFSWDAAAAATWDVYDRVVAEVGVNPRRPQPHLPGPRRDGRHGGGCSGVDPRAGGGGPRNAVHGLPQSGGGSSRRQPMGRVDPQRDRPRACGEPRCMGPR